MPSNLSCEILNSTDSPFSDKLSLFCSIAVLANLISTYSSSKLSVLRKDLLVVLTNLSAEVALLIKDGMEIMVRRGWFEAMPKNVDRFGIIDSNEDRK